MNAKFIKSFESIIYDLLPSKKAILQEAIHRCTEETNTWLNESISTSELNIRMYFIQRLSEIVPTAEALQSEKLLSVLLDDTGLRKVGDFIELKGEKWEVIWRQVSKNFGIVLGLKNKSGKIISTEFVD